MGNREGLRDLTLYNVEGEERSGFRVEALGQVAFSVLAYDDVTLKNASHTWGLVRSGSTYAHFDYLQLGIGNGSCGQGTGTIPAYQLPASGTYSHSLRFIPLAEYEASTGISVPLTDHYAVRYDAKHRTVVCTGNFSSGTTATLYDMGGLIINSSTAINNTSIVIPTGVLPCASYLVSIRGNEGTYMYKIAIF